MSTKICTQCGGEYGPEQRFCPNDGTALRAMDAKDPLVGQIIADRYQILDLLGAGGMGRVYLSEHVRIGRRSAVKVMSPTLALAADAISRFNREAANASRINQPNVAQIYDFGETPEGVLYLAMEFIEGDTLSTIVEREGALLLGRAAQITKQVGDALGAAHHMGIVHRDLKPDNIMLARHIDGSDWVKVVDFGIAKTVQGSGEGGSQTVTTAGVSLGTPEYMSPEQLAGDRLDNRTDIYSLGLVCFNLLTADLPYPRVTSKETLVRRLTSKPHTLGEIRPDGDWPPALQAALDRALAPEPEDRYASAAEFGRDVVAAVAGVGEGAETVRIAPAVAGTPAPAPSIAPNRGSTRKLETPVTAAPKRRVVPIAVGVMVVAAAAAAIVLALTRSKAPAVRSSDVRNLPVVLTPSSPKAAPVSKPATIDAIPGLPAVSTVSAAARTIAKHAAPPPVEKKESVATTRLARAPDSARSEPAASSARGGFRHSFLRMNGDSSQLAELPPNATDAQRIAILRQDIQAHMGRANTFLLNRDLLRARAEMREVGPVLRALNQLYPDAQQTRQVDGLVRLSLAKAFAACRNIVADTAAARSTPPNFRCESLGQGLPGGRGRGGDRSPPVPR